MTGLLQYPPGVQIFQDGTVVDAANPLAVNASVTISPSDTQAVQGVGVAGIPAGNLLTVQGTASGTPIPVSGSLTIGADNTGTLTLNSALTNTATAALGHGQTTVQVSITGLTASGGALTPNSFVNGVPGNVSVYKGTLQFTSVTADGVYVFGNIGAASAIGFTSAGSGTGTVTMAYDASTASAMGYGVSTRIAWLGAAIWRYTDAVSATNAVAVGYDGSAVHVLNTDTLGHAQVNVLNTVTVAGTVTAGTGTVAVSGGTLALLQAGSVAITNSPTVVAGGGTIALLQAGTVVNNGGSVTVTQATGTNLHTVVDSGTLTLSGTSTITGAITVANGADVAQGSTADAAWTSGNGTAIAILKGIATIASAPLAGGNGTATIGGVVVAHDSLSTTGIAPVTTLTTLEVGHVLKAGAGNLYSCYVTNTGTAAGYLIITNTTTVTANGTLGSGVIVDCIAVGSLSTNGINYAPGPPEYCSTGISAVFSSTAAPVVTQVGSCWFKALVV